MSQLMHTRKVVNRFFLLRERVPLPFDLRPSIFYTSAMNSSCGGTSTGITIKSRTTGTSTGSRNRKNTNSTSNQLLVPVYRAMATQLISLFRYLCTKINFIFGRRIRCRTCYYRIVSLTLMLMAVVLSSTIQKGRYLIWQANHMDGVTQHRIQSIHIHIPVANQIEETNSSSSSYIASSNLQNTDNRSILPTTENIASPKQEQLAVPSVYKFPAKPLYNIHSLLQQSIGKRILNHPTKNPLRNCSPTVQFQVRAMNNGMEFTIQSMMMTTTTTTNDTNADNSQKQQPIQIIPKPYGGDEIYVEWVQFSSGSSNQHPYENDNNTDADTDADAQEMGVAMITDHNNGTYTCKFIRPPSVQHRHDTMSSRISSTNQDIDIDNQRQSVNGRLTIYYDYTCGIGSIFAPHKDQYRRAGEVHVSLTNDNVPKPYIHPFVPPNSNTNTDDSDNTNNHLNQKIDLSKYHTVIAFGDSLMMQLVRRYTLGGYWSPNIIYGGNINQCLSNLNDTVTAIDKFNSWHQEHILTAVNSSSSSSSSNGAGSIAAILGSAVWDAMRGCVHSDFIDHRMAIRTMIRTIQSLYPMVDIYWKSPSAIVLHRRNSLEELIDNKVWTQRSRYISDGIPRKMHNVQKELMNEMGIPFLDLYDAYFLSAPFSRPGDCRHYNDDISSLLLSYYWNGLNRSQVYYH